MANHPSLTTHVDFVLPEHLGVWLSSTKRNENESPQGVVLLVHGLNLYAPRMDVLGEWFLSHNYDVLRVSLAGHGDSVNPELSTGKIDHDRKIAFQSTSAQQWLDELEQAVHVARARANQHQVPLVYLGFSLGGLIGTVLQQRSAEQPSFDRMILLAPALAMTAWANVLRPLKPFPKVGIPAFTPKKYKANKTTPIQAYHAMFALYDELHDSDFSEWNTPTLVLSDVNDEMVPFERLTAFLETHELDWTLYPLHQKLGGKRRHFHLMLDPESVGEPVWKRMTAQVTSFLENPYPATSQHS